MAYVTPSADQQQALDAFQDAFEEIERLLTVYTYQGRRPSIARTHLETAQMFINKAITKGDSE